MRGIIRLGAAALALAIVTKTPARATEWVPVATTARDIAEVDLDSVDVKRDVVKVWVRRSFKKPEQDKESGKRVVSELSMTTENCADRTYRLGEFVLRDKDGAVVRSGSGAEGWKNVLPGSVGEGSWRLACAIVHPPKEKAWVADFDTGGWRDLGVSKDETYRLWIKTADLMKLDNGYVVAVSRSEYAAPVWTNGFAIRYAVSAYVTDCANRKTAVLGEDFYVAPDLRVGAYRVQSKDLDFGPIPAASFLAKNLKEICAAARPIDAKAGHGDEGEGPQIASGTAWAVDKGYLVTAAHVIEDADAIDVYRDGDKVGEAKVVVADFANDLAILAFTKAPPGKLKVLPIASHGAVLGRSVFTLGYPAPEVLGQAVKMTSGQINSTSGFEDDTRLLQISIPVQGGNSGGPVLGWDGSVVGVVDSKLLKLDEDGEDPPQNVNYAVKAAYLRPMLDDLPDLGNYETVKAGASQEATIAAARQAVFMLLAGH